MRCCAVPPPRVGPAPASSQSHAHHRWRSGARPGSSCRAARTRPSGWYLASRTATAATAG
eukprot:1138015-Pyramimonas_sp.AAC.1